jgi:hypothetical protein
LCSRAGARPRAVAGFRFRRFGAPDVDSTRASVAGWPPGPGACSGRSNTATANFPRPRVLRGVRGVRPVTITSAAVRSARIRPAAALWRSLTGFGRAVRPSGRRPVRLRTAPRTLSAIRVARRLPPGRVRDLPRGRICTRAGSGRSPYHDRPAMSHPEERHTSPDPCARHADYATLGSRSHVARPARSVVGQLAKPGGDQSLPAGFGGRALLKPRPIERRLPLRWPQRSVPGGALETRHPGSRRMRHRGWLRFKNRSDTYRCPRSTRTVTRIVQDKTRSRSRSSPRSGIAGGLASSLDSGASPRIRAPSRTISSRPPAGGAWRASSRRQSTSQVSMAK